MGHVRLASSAVSSLSVRSRGLIGTTVRVALQVAAMVYLVGQTVQAQTAMRAPGRPSVDSKDANSSDGSATPTESSSDADAAFEAGVAAYRRGDYAAARDAFMLAYEQDPSYRTAAVLGQTEEKLGHLPQAATLLDWAMFHLEPSVEPEAKARIQADLALLRERVLTLKLETPVQFQEVLIDDLVFTTNSLRILADGENRWTIYLEPTKHDVTVRSEGYQPQQRQVAGVAGQLLDWQIRWSPLVPPNVTEPNQPSVQTQTTGIVSNDDPTSAADHSNDWQLPVAIATGGLALVAAGFGVYSLHEYNAASDRFDDARATLEDASLTQPCALTSPASTRNACRAVAGADQETVTHGNRAIAAFSAAGALALSSAAFWLWWHSSNPAEPSAVSLTFAPSVGQADWGGVVTCRY